MQDARNCFSFRILYFNLFSFIEKINYLQERKKFLSNEIKKDSTKKVLLENNVNEQERIAREKYLMKKDNEDLFIIR